MAAPLPPRVAPRLAADFTLQRAGFHLHARLELDAEILVLFGPSGSGKTTTLNAIAGLITPERGHILLDGRYLFRRDDATGPLTQRVPARHRNIGYVFQNYALFPHLTALENVGFAVRGARGPGDRCGVAGADEPGAPGRSLSA